jgi:hypothetical protein
MHSFQAPELCERLGQRQLASVEDYAEGHQNLLLRKRLDETS